MAHANGSLPTLTKDGTLPVGIHTLTLRALLESPLVTGVGIKGRWDRARRGQLVRNLSILAGQLRTVGVEQLLLGGSFVEDKPYPNGLDGVFPFPPGPAALAGLVSELNALDPMESWGWGEDSMRWTEGRRRLLLWINYQVELFPDWGQPSGISSADGRALTFTEALALRVDGQPRGVVRILL